MLKKILLTILFVILTAAAGTGYFLFAGDYVRRCEEGETIDRIEVAIKDSLENSLVIREDILSFLHSGEGIIGLRRGSVMTDSLEKHLLERGEIASAEVYSLSNGALGVEVTQRRAAVRFSGSGKEFYSDPSGYLFPVYKKCDVPIVTGTIPIGYRDGYRGYPSSGKEAEWLEGIHSLTSYIEAHYYWHRTVEQIHVAPGGDIILYTRDGRQKFIFGDCTGIEDKFARMAIYYKGIAPLSEAERYTSVNLKYDNQIICK